MVGVQERNEQARYAIERGLSHRRACTLVRANRSSLSYHYKMPAKDAPVIAAMKELSGVYPRFGSRRIRIFLQRNGITLGKKLKCLTVVDEYTRGCLAIDVSSAIRSKRVIEVLTRLISIHDVPRYLRSDNGPEFVSTALLEWVGCESFEIIIMMSDRIRV